MDEIDKKQQDEIEALKGKDLTHDELFDVIKSNLKFIQQFFMGMVFLEFVLILGTWAALLIALTFFKK